MGHYFKQCFAPLNYTRFQSFVNFYIFNVSSNKKKGVIDLAQTAQESN